MQQAGGIVALRHLDTLLKGRVVSRIARHQLAERTGFAEQSKDLAGHIGSERNDPTGLDPDPFGMCARQDEDAVLSSGLQQGSQELAFLAAHDIRLQRRLICDTGGDPATAGPKRTGQRFIDPGQMFSEIM